MPNNYDINVFLSDIKSNDRKIRWDAIEKACAEIENSTITSVPISSIPYLLFELNYDYSEQIDKEFDEIREKYGYDVHNHIDRDAIDDSHFFRVMKILLSAKPEDLLNYLPSILKISRKPDQPFPPDCYHCEYYLVDKTDDDILPTALYRSDVYDMLLLAIGVPSIPVLIQSLSQDEPTAKRAGSILYKWGKEAIPWLQKAVNDPDILVQHRVRQILDGLRADYQKERPSTLQTQFSRIHARLMTLLDDSRADSSLRERLETLCFFSKYGSFRQVAIKEHGSPDHSGPKSRLRILGESLGVPLTRTILEPGKVNQTVLTEEGVALVEWLRLHPWALG